MSDSPLDLDMTELAHEGPGASSFVSEARVVAFAEATNASTRPCIGDPAPLLYGVVPTRPAVIDALARVLPAGIGARIPILHGEHLVRCHRPLLVGQSVVAAGTPIAIRVKASGTTVTVLAALRDQEGLVEEHEMTAFLPGIQLGHDMGHRAPLPGPPTLTSGADGHLTATTLSEQSRMYARASGDESPFHVDDDIARTYGFPGVIMHGLCTLAVTVNCLVDLRLAPSRPYLLGARFSRPALPGTPLGVAYWSGPSKAVRFECLAQGGEVVLSHGLVE